MIKFEENLKLILMRPGIHQDLRFNRLWLLLAVCMVVIPLVAQDGLPLFTLRDATYTGIDFENTVVDTREHNILIYSNYYGGAGVGIADFDNDGLLDIFLAGNLVGDRLYRNRGNLKFEDITAPAGIIDNGGWSSGVVIADVNGDGWQDIYVTRELYDNRPDLRKNVLYINNGQASPLSFTEKARAYGVDDDRRSRHATFLDYDKDGDLDLFVLNQPPNPGNLSDLYGTLPGPEFASRLYRNNGDETFTDVSQMAGVDKPGYPNSVTASDLNNDGWTDLYVANDFQSPDFCYLNQGDGTFVDVLTDAFKHISYFSMGVDAADLTNDGWMDLMVLDMVAEDNYRLKANMSGMDPNAFWKVVAEGGHYQYMFNTLQWNQGMINGQLLFSDVAQMASVATTDWSWSNLIADFDNDGWKDIHVTNGLLRDIRNTDADKKFSNHVEEIAYDWIDKNPNAGEISIWDILDLQEALKMVPSQKLPNYAFKNLGDLNFSNTAAQWGLDHPTFSHGSAYGDLDNDGDLDLVINNVNDKAFIYENHARSRKTHYLRINLKHEGPQKTTFGSRIKIAQKDQEQWYELTNVRGMYSTSEQTAHFGLNDPSNIEEITITWPDGKITRMSNVAVDQLLEVHYSSALKESSEVIGSPRWFEESTSIAISHRENDFNDYEKQVLLPHKMSQFGPALASGDVNADGLEDLFVGGAKGQPAQLLLQIPNGQFRAVEVTAFSTDAEFEDVAAVFFDVDSDGDPDLYVVSGGNEWEAGSPFYQDRLYLNQGSGKMVRSQGLPAIAISGSCARPFDYDQDGDLDLFVGGRHVPWQYPTPASSLLLRNDGGKFTDMTKSVARELQGIGMVTDAVWTDFDQDGHTDLVLVGEWMSITFMRFNGQKFQNITHRQGIPHSQGWWYSIEAEDMDHDGDVDLIAGNLGLNYKYKATPSEPFEVFYNDFDDNGSPDIVLSYYNFGDRYPLRGRSCSAQQVPSLKYEFPTYEQFASANLLQVYGLEKLNPALHYEAHTFASSYLENQGNGSFKMHKLPNPAQTSSVNDILIDDFNNDGHKDLLLAGNLFPSEVETTRNDAGIGSLLLGNGDGAFVAVPARESGFALPYDVKQLTWVKTNSGRLVVCGINNGPLKIFKVQDHKKL